MIGLEGEYAYVSMRVCVIVASFETGDQLEELN